MNRPRGPVLIAYDGSAAARQAIVDAAALLGSGTALVVTVWEAGLAYPTTAMGPDQITMIPSVDPEVALELDRGLHEQAEQMSREGTELARSLGLDAKALAVSDESNVANTLLRIAHECDAAAIVVGSRGLSGLRARMEGSTSKALLKHADCPLLVVHEREHEAS